MKNVVFDYKVDESNFILSWKQWAEKKRPELIDAQHPLPEMNTMARDSYGRIYSGSHIFRLENGVSIAAVEYNEPEIPNRCDELEARINALEEKTK